MSDLKYSSLATYEFSERDIHVLIRTFQDKNLSSLQRVNCEGPALLRALVSQLDKLNGGGSLFPFDSQLRSLPDAGGEVLVQLDIRTTLVRRPAAHFN